MNKIISPLVYGDTKQEIVDLQKALFKLGLDPINEDEINNQFFGESTCNSLKAFKDKFQIQIFPCLVENKTADAINSRLFQINMTVVLANQLKIIPPLFFGMKSQAVIDLQAALARIGFGANIDPAEKGVFDKTTCSAVINFQREMGITVNPCYVDSETADKMNSMIDNIPADNGHNGGDVKYVVSGYVYDTQNKIVDKQSVIAYDIDLLGSGVYKKAKTIAELTAKGGIQILGKQGITNDNGFYSIEFSNSDFITDESDVDPTADVIVVAVDGDVILGRSLLARGKDYVNNELKNWNIKFSDEVVKRGSSEFEIVSSVILRFLSTQITKVEAWQIQDDTDMIEFLADEVDLSKEKVSAYVNADFLLHDALNSSPEIPSFAADAQKTIELLYGLVKPTSISSWSGVSKTAIADAINYILQSSLGNIIGAFSEADISAFVDAMHNYSIKKSLSQNIPLKNILNIAIKDDALIEKFHSLYINHNGTPKEFWDNLANDDDLKNNVDALKLTNQLSALTGNNVQAMTSLTSLVKNNDIVSLFELSAEDWNTAIGNTVPSFIKTGTVDDYRNFMISQLQAAFYSEKVSLMMKSEDEIKIADQSMRDMLNTFMTSTKFDLRYNRLFDKITDSEDTFQKRLDDIGGDQKEDLRNQLSKLQRIFQFSPTPEVMSKILSTDIDSATMVASLPFSTFKVKYSSIGDDQTLLAIHQRACHIVSMLEYSILSINRFSQSANIPAITGK